MLSLRNNMGVVGHLGRPISRTLLSVITCMGVVPGRPISRNLLSVTTCMGVVSAHSGRPQNELEEISNSCPVFGTAACGKM